MKRVKKHFVAGFRV